MVPCSSSHFEACAKCHHKALQQEAVHRRPKSQPQSPHPTAPEQLRPTSTQSRARETRKRGHTAAETPKTRRLRRASAVRPARERPPRPRTAAALDERRESKHTKSREARAVAATSDEDGHQLIQNFARTQA